VAIGDLGGGPLRRARTATRLADGRELIYFDDTAAVARTAPDRRDLPPVDTGSVLRLDVLTGEWVTIAAHRMKRTFLPPAAQCPLCPTRPGGEPTEIPEADYDVVVFENRFPSFGTVPDQPTPDQPTPDQPTPDQPTPDQPTADRSMPGPATGVDGDPLRPQRPAVGRCEVVCFTSDHDASLAHLPLRRVRTVIDALADRTAALSALPGVEQVFCFENRGREIGVTVEHPHGQVYGYPFVPPRTAQLLGRAAQHHRRTGRDLLGDVLDAERRASRIVWAGEHWTAFVPAAARWPVEVHLVPHRAVPDLAALDDTERAELADAYRDVLGRVEAFFGDGEPPPYVAGWHQAPVHTGRDLTRLHLQLFSVRRAPGKLKYLAGSESGMGAWINDSTPECIAARLRDR